MRDHANDPDFVMLGIVRDAQKSTQAVAEVRETTKA